MMSMMWLCGAALYCLVAPVCAMCQFANCTGTGRTMLFAVSMLPLVILLAEQAPRVLCRSGGNDAAGDGHVWSRSYGVVTNADQFYTLGYTEPEPNGRPRGRTPRLSRRENRIISFQTRDTGIEVEINFAIPFMTIPVRKTMSGLVDSLVKGTPLLNINLGAVAIAGALTVGSALIGAAARAFSHGNGTRPVSMPASMERPTLPKPESRHQDEDNVKSGWERESAVWALLGSAVRAMGQYDFDTVACLQRTVCWYVREAVIAVGEGTPSSFDVVIEGLSRADWIGTFTGGIRLQEAFRAGREATTSCQESFASCSVHTFIDNVVQMARKGTL